MNVYLAQSVVLILKTDTKIIWCGYTAHTIATGCLSPWKAQPGVENNIATGCLSPWKAQPGVEKVVGGAPRITL